MTAGKSDLLNQLVLHSDRLYLRPDGRNLNSYCSTDLAQISWDWLCFLQRPELVQVEEAIYGKSCSFAAHLHDAPQVIFLFNREWPGPADNREHWIVLMIENTPPVTTSDRSYGEEPLIALWKTSLYQLTSLLLLVQLLLDWMTCGTELMHGFCALPEPKA